MDTMRPGALGEGHFWDLGLCMRGSPFGTAKIERQHRRKARRPDISANVKNPDLSSRNLSKISADFRELKFFRIFEIQKFDKTRDF